MYCLRVKYIGLRTASVRDCFFAREVSSTVEDYVKVCLRLAAVKSLQLTGGREENKFLNQKYVCPKFPFVEDGEFTVSASRPLIIEYSSSGNPKNKGILLEYQTVDVGCGGIYNQNTGTISSPSYPNRYLPHMHCTYHISVMWVSFISSSFVLQYFSLRGFVSLSITSIWKWYKTTTAPTTVLRFMTNTLTKQIMEICLESKF